MNISQSEVTNIVIKWLDMHEYSRNHWAEVAKEILKRNDNKKELAILELAQALENFHHMYKDKVVKSDNLLHELLSTCYLCVDWKKVASSRY